MQAVKFIGLCGEFFVEKRVGKDVFYSCDLFLGREYLLLNGLKLFLLVIREFFSGGFSAGILLFFF